MGNNTYLCYMEKKSAGENAVRYNVSDKAILNIETIKLYFRKHKNKKMTKEQTADYMLSNFKQK